MHAKMHAMALPWVLMTQLAAKDEGYLDARTNPCYLLR